MEEMPDMNDLILAIREYYKYPENVKKFEEWKRKEVARSERSNGYQETYKTS